MLPHKKQLLRRNAWFRQQLPTQQSSNNTKQNSAAVQKPIIAAVNNPSCAE